jgi:hypothetical protein
VSTLLERLRLLWRRKIWRGFDGIAAFTRGLDSIAAFRGTIQQILVRFASLRRERREAKKACLFQGFTLDELEDWKLERKRDVSTVPFSAFSTFALNQRFTHKSPELCPLLLLHQNVFQYTLHGIQAASRGSRKFTSFCNQG